MKIVNGHLLVIRMMRIQISDRDQSLNLSGFINNRKMPNSVLSEDALSLIG